MTVTVPAPPGVHYVIAGGSDFTIGVWTDITPPGLNLNPHDFTDSFGIIWTQVDPNNNNNVYCCVDQKGFWKSTNKGLPGSWTLVGSSAGPYTGPDTGRTYFDSPFSLRIPKTSQGTRWYMSCGVRGSNLGFWYSDDFGVTWNCSPGFRSVAPTYDVTCFDVDPSDWNHIILQSHSGWPGFSGGAGVLESFDGGITWTAHAPPAAWKEPGTAGIHFLYDLPSGQGNSSRWLCGINADVVPVDLGGGQWLSTNSGASWTRVSTNPTIHGGQSHYYATNGKVYVGAYQYPLVSADNGNTWAQVTGLPVHYYYGVWGNGTTLFSGLSSTGDNGGYSPDQPMETSLETDGVTWAKAVGDNVTHADGPYNQDTARDNKIQYSSHWASGLWALKYAA